MDKETKEIDCPEDKDNNNDVLKLPNENEFFSLTMSDNFIVLRIFDKTLIDDFFETLKDEPNCESVVKE